MPTPRVLALVAKSPLPPVTGSRVRIKQLIEGLSKRGQVTVIVAANVSDTERRLLERWPVGRVLVAGLQPKRPSVAERLGWGIGLGPERTWLYQSHAQVVETLHAELDRRPDVLWVSGRWAARFLNRLALPPLVVDMQAPERLALVREVSAMVRGFHWSGVRRFGHFVLDARSRLSAEQQLWSRASLITPVSDDDASRVPVRWSGKLHVVINGVDVPESTMVTSGSSRIVFLGNMNYAPNADAARWITTDIFPRIRSRKADAELILVGTAPEALRVALARPNVTFAGFVEDLRPVFAACSVAMLAVRDGAGTRLKVLEALAHGVPVVTTPVGNEGIGTADGVHLLVRQSSEDLADAAVSMLNEPERAAHLARAGRQFVSASHGWSRACADLWTGIEGVLQEGRGGLLLDDGSSA